MIFLQNNIIFQLTLDFICVYTSDVCGAAGVTGMVMCGAESPNLS